MKTETLTIVWERSNGVKLVAILHKEPFDALHDKYEVRCIMETKGGSINMIPNMPLMERIRNAQQLINKEGI